MSTMNPLWGEGASLPLPKLTNAVEADVCVVGLGGSGLACIRELLRAGRRVVGLDARGIAGGAAGRNGGFLLGGLAMFHHDAITRFGRTVAREIYAQTLTEIARMADETPLAVRRTGSLRIAVSDAEWDDCSQQLEAMQRDGLPVEPYDGPEGRGLLFPSDAAFDPAMRCRTLAHDALERGARLFERSSVVQIDDGMVRTPDGCVRAPRIVVAVDGKLDVILPQLADRVRSARLQMLATAPAHDVELPRPVYARWGLDYWQQRPDRRIVLGGGRDVGGDAEWTTDDSPSEHVQSALDMLLRSAVRTAAPVTHRWAATVAYTASGVPVLDEVRPCVWAVGGYSGTGNVVGALCGRAAAELALGRQSKIANLLRG